MENRIYNFSPGPATLPVSVLQEAQRHLLALPGTGMSVLEMSHRSKPFKQILDTTKQNLRTLLKLPEDFHILFLQGGASLQFAMVPMNFLAGQGKPASYLVTGTWGQKAIAEAKGFGPVHLAWSGEKDRFMRLPKASEITLDPNAAYLHFTSNETIQGLQFPREPDAGSLPLICDASSDFLSRPIDVQRYAMIYAGAQKNAGPAGVTIVLIPRRRGLAVQHPGDLCHLHCDAGHELAAARHRRSGQNGPAQPRKGEIALRRHRRQRRLLSGLRPAGGPVGDECHLSPAQQGEGRGVCGPGPAARPA
jgi:phosphoserine aminotransferase